jgi:hypothetical protein
MQRRAGSTFIERTGKKLFVALAFLLVVGPAMAKTVPEGQELLVERVQNGFAVTPDFKFTEVDDRFANLAGVYGGWIHDHRLLTGAGAYWLTNRSSDFKLWYGGGVVEWFANPGGVVNLSLRGLVGGGSGTLSTELTVPAAGFRGDDRWKFGRVGPGDGKDDRWEYSTTTVAVPVSRAFFVVEPQANLFVNLTSRFRLGVGASYRAIAGAGQLGERLRGVSANFSLQFGSF